MVKRRVRRAKTSRRKKRVPQKAVAANRRAQWNAYKGLQKRVNHAWNKLRRDVKRKASPQVFLRDRNQLLLLLGECDYMRRECMRHATKSKRR